MDTTYLYQAVVYDYVNSTLEPHYYYVVTLNKRLISFCKDSDGEQYKLIDSNENFFEILETIVDKDELWDTVFDDEFRSDLIDYFYENIEEYELEGKEEFIDDVVDDNIKFRTFEKDCYI